MKQESFGLSPREVSVLISIREGQRTRKNIAHDLGVSPPELTRLVKSLKSKGLVVVQRQGMSSSVSISDLKHASRLMRILSEFSHMRLERILSLTTLDVLSCLAVSPGSTRGDIMSSSGVSARTLQTTLKRLRELGVVRVRAGGVYEISDRFEPFAEFAREFDEYSNQRMAREFCQDSVVVWQNGKEFIIRTKCEKEAVDFKRTAYSVFEDYGVPLFLDWHYYYHPVGTWCRTLDEVFLQSLLIIPRNSRENTAMLMLWEKNALWRNLRRLRGKAMRYGLDGELEAIVAYFRDPEKNRRPGFPYMSELKDKLRGDV
jgi:DNA-binding MarR family transcriptional regulator